MSNKNKTYIIIVVIILVLTIIPQTRQAMASSFSFVFTPIQKSISSSSLSSSKFFTGIREFVTLRSQNEELSNKIKNLSIDKAKLKELEIENENLKKQLGFIEEHKELSLIPAKIVGREPTSFLDYIIIDKGSNEEVSENSAVVSDGFLVGKVTEVYANQSKITLITSKDSIVQAMLQENRVRGVLKGGLSGITLESIPQDIEVVTNENVITSGLGGDILQGLLVGEVVSQQSSKAEIFKTLNVRSLVDFSKLEIVFIIKNENI